MHMYFDQIHSLFPLLFSFSSPIPPPLSRPNFVCFVFFSPLNPLSAIGVCMGLEPSGCVEPPVFAVCEEK